MMVSEVTTKSGKKSLYLRKGSLHIVNRSREVIINDVYKRHWYYEGDWEYDGKNGVVLLKGSLDCITQNFKALSSRRKHMISVVYFPTEIRLVHEDSSFHTIKVF